MPKKTDDHTIISWKAPEFFHYKKSHWWFPAQAAITLALTAIFILTGQYLVAIIVVLGAIIIYQLAHQEPEVLPVIFSPQGIKCKGRFLPYQELKSFWIIESGSVKKLYLQQVERFSLPVVVPLVKQDIEKVRAFLRHYIPENTDVKEDFADKLLRFLRI